MFRGVTEVKKFCNQSSAQFFHKVISKTQWQLNNTHGGNVAPPVEKSQLPELVRFLIDTIEVFCLLHLVRID